MGESFSNKDGKGGTRSREKRKRVTRSCFLGGAGLPPPFPADPPKMGNGLVAGALISRSTSVSLRNETVL